MKIKLPKLSDPDLLAAANEHARDHAEVRADRLHRLWVPVSGCQLRRVTNYVLFAHNNFYELMQDEPREEVEREKARSVRALNRHYKARFPCKCGKCDLG